MPETSELKRSVSGVRGIVGDTLTPELVARHAAAFGSLLSGDKVVVASDTRPTGPMIKEAAISGLQSVGCDVIDIGIAPTPTVPLAVTHFKAAGGIAVTASHNPIEWNALKFIGSATQLLSPTLFDRIYDLADGNGRIAYRGWDKIGSRTSSLAMLNVHIRRVLSLKQVATRAVARRKPKVVLDAVNGAGSVYAPALLRKLACRVVEIHCRPDGRFPRGTEPLPENLKDLCAAVVRHRADIGFALDPDADRLAVVDEQGKPLGEERTLVLATEWVLSRTPGPVVINLSTTQAVLDVAKSHKQRGYTAKVGEANVAAMIKSKHAVIGGEGNGGVIMPSLHPGRDAMLGMALVLSYLSHADQPISQLSAGLPMYYAAKTRKAQSGDWQDRLSRFADHFGTRGQIDTRDGIKVTMDGESVHARASNTEPIVRISTEARTQKQAKALLSEALESLGY
ncbi:MAG TPA: phosphoglucosamine mutase [candidate division Zixibacteria bacterium]